MEIAGFKVILGDFEALADAHKRKVIEFCLDRHLESTSPALLDRFARDVRAIFPTLAPSYIFSGCILLGFDAPESDILGIEHQIEDGAADTLAAKYGIRSVTIFCSLTAQHNISFR